MTRNNLKIAFRHLQKNKFFSGLNIASLAAGLTVALSVGLWVWDEVSFDQYTPDLERVAAVMQNQTFDGVVETSWNQPKQTAKALRNDFGSHFEHVALISSTGSSVLSTGAKKLARKGYNAEQGLAEMLGLKMIHGTWADFEDPNKVLLAAPTAEALFGTTAVVGESLTFNQTEELTISGVYEALPSNHSFADLDFMTTWALYEQRLPDWLGWGNNWFQVIVKVQPSAQLANVSDLIADAKYDRMAEDEGKRFNPKLFLHPMSDWNLKSKFENGSAVGGRITSVRAFGFIGLLVLLLACINFMNLSTARSEQRALEVGIRKTMGSRRGQLIGQFYSESFLLSAMGGGLALLLMFAFLPFLNQLAEKDLSIPFSSPAFWGIFVTICAVTGFLAGSYPALYLSGFSPLSAMRNSETSGRSQHRPRQVLVVAQFAVSVILIVGTIVINQQIQFAKDRPIGFQEKGLIGVPLRGKDIREKFNAFQAELLETGTVSAVGKSDNPITSSFITNSGFDWSGKPADFQDEFLTIRITPEFGEAVGWELKAGRDFLRERPADSLAFVINEAAAQYLGFDDPVGQRIEWDEGEFYTIIGVVKDMLTQSPYTPVKQTLFFLDEPRANYANIRIAPTASTTEALAAVESVFKHYDGFNDFTYELISDEHAKKFGEEERTGKLISVFALLAIFISCLGLFGMAAYVAERRTKEIGIRKVLGASVTSVVALISSDFLALVIIALVAAIPVAYYLVQSWLTDFPYRVALQWWMFAGAGVLAIVVALLTVGLQSWRAAVINPVDSLRS